MADLVDYLRDKLEHAEHDALTYAHDAHCNVIHLAGPEPCPPWCDHDWKSSEFFTNRSCAKCKSVVSMYGHGLTITGWIGNQPERTRPR